MLWRFEKGDLALGEHEGLLLRFAFEAQEPLGARLEVMSKPDAADTRGTHVDAGEPPLVGNAGSTRGREVEREL